MTGEHDERGVALLVFHRGVVDGNFLWLRGFLGEEHRVAAFLAAEHQVLDADVGERAARHDAVVAAT